MTTSNQLPDTRHHNLFHHLAMIFYSELINIIWFFTSVALLMAGLAVFKFAQGQFFRIAIGLPIMLIGVSIGLFKIHEIILVVARPKRLKAMCIFCHN